ncbi:hypothetical protein Tco_1419457, partial [Tanacetum coccineum]
IRISSAGDFLGTAPSYTSIKDPILRLCYKFIAYSIAGRSQAPEKVIVTDLFYLRGMDVSSVNVPYLLARWKLEGGLNTLQRDIMGLDLTKYDLYPSFIEDLTAKGMGLRVTDSNTGNHRKDDFTPLETI